MHVARVREYIPIKYTLQGQSYYRIYSFYESEKGHAIFRGADEAEIWRRSNISLNESPFKTIVRSPTI